MNGLFLIDRKMLSHHIVGMQNKDRFCMWIWLLSAAAWKPRPIFVQGKEIILQRGQLFVSLRKFAEENGVSKGVAERFVRDLKSGTMIETANETGGTVITICNYEIYQDFDLYRGTANGTANETATGQRRDIKEHQITPVTPERTNNPQTPMLDLDGEASPAATVSQQNFDDEFEKVWKAYPRKVGKGAARKAWAKARKRVSKDEIAPSLWAHIQVWNQGTAKDKIPHLSTWLNGERWCDDPEAAANRSQTSDEKLNALMAPEQDPLGNDFLSSYNTAGMIAGTIKRIGGTSDDT